MVSLTAYEPRKVFNEDGASAVEFALIAPLLAVLYLGSVEVSFMMEDDRRLTRVATTFGDLATRFDELTVDALDEIHHAARLVMQPADISDAQIRLTSFAMDGADATVEWSVACNWTARAEDSVVTIPASVEPAAGASVLMTEIQMDVEGVFDFIPATTGTLSDIVYATPRESNAIPLEPDTLANTYICPFQSGGGGG